ncbi:MAG: methylenetetrahydrofolate reductase C-terminal domain-containing protein [Betaproteobacteria bacterium]|nr:methylenetetrahydrofolate reductase C-terminal domain-containing protein [Betaproteobacteria bacterium]
MLSAGDKLKLLRINSFVGEASLDFLSAAATAAVEQSFEKGQLVYAKDEAATAFYVLAEGTVGHPEVQRSDASASQINTPGQMFGFAASQLDRRTLSARCEAPTRVLALDFESFLELCRGHGYAELPSRLAFAHKGYERDVLGRSGWISVRNVCKSFEVGEGQAALLDDCSFEVRPGELWALFGPKGRGKTVLLNLIAGFERVNDGVILVDGEVTNRPGMRPLHGPEHVVGYRTAIHVLRTTVAGYLQGGEEKSEKLRLLCEQLGFAPYMASRLRDVPRDVARRVEILRAFLRDPYVVLDEPTRGLEGDDKAALTAFVLQAHSLLPKTMLFATEDIDEAIFIADQVLVMTPAGAKKLPVAVDVRRPRGADQRELPEFTRAKQRVLDALEKAESVAPLREGFAIEVDEALPARRLPNVANALKEALHEGRFFWTIEFIPSVDKVLHDALHKLGGTAEIMRQEPELVGFSVTDRVVSDRDPEPLAPASRLLEASCKQPLVHFSGKGRDISDLHSFLERMEEHKLENMLCLTGDRLREEKKGERARYLESVCAIQIAKQARPELQIAAALNPFKYREEDAMAQYLKLGKKVGAGADFIITQIGFDMHKYEEALFWVGTRNYRVPLVANLLPMAAARARYLRAHQLAGVTITDSFLALLEAEERLMPDKGASRVLRRLALQILGVRFYGYSGVQLTGIHSVEKLSALRNEVAMLSELCSDRITWNRAWDEALTLPEGGRANPAPSNNPWYLVNRRTKHAQVRERIKYKVMDGVHDFVFDRGLAARMLKAAFVPIARHSKADRVVERVERGIKAPLFGCESCGMCRLAATQYVCPETCPKGLANGACGGTTDNLCEFRDRECIHSVKYRIANDMGVAEQLEKWLIPAVPANIRGTSSWPPHFKDEGPKVEVIDFLHPEQRETKGW